MLYLTFVDDDVNDNEFDDEEEDVVTFEDEEEGKSKG